MLVICEGAAVIFLTKNMTLFKMCEWQKVKRVCAKRFEKWADITWWQRETRSSPLPWLLSLSLLGVISLARDSGQVSEPERSIPSSSTITSPTTSSLLYRSKESTTKWRVRIWGGKEFECISKLATGDALSWSAMCQLRGNFPVSFQGFFYYWDKFWGEFWISSLSSAYSKVFTKSLK